MGTKGGPYIESDEARPLNVYGRTKLEGEQFVQNINPKHYVLRTAALYGNHPCRAKGGQNFVDLMLRLARERGRVRVVDNEFTTPTATADLALQIAALSHSDAFGLYHATAEGSCSWYEFAREIFRVADVSVTLEAAVAERIPGKSAPSLIFGAGKQQAQGSEPEPLSSLARRVAQLSISKAASRCQPASLKCSMRNSESRAR